MSQRPPRREMGVEGLPERVPALGAEDVGADDTAGD
jgi:hypothetical protein